MLRGEVRFADLDPAQGSESDKTRPVVVVSNDRANATAQRLDRGVVTVVPVSSNVSRVLAFQVRLPAGSCGLPRESKAQAEQVRALSIQRLGPALGRLSASLLDELDDALRLHLQL